MKNNYEYRWAVCDRAGDVYPSGKLKRILRKLVRDAVFEAC